MQLYPGNLKMTKLISRALLILNAHHMIPMNLLSDNYNVIEKPKH